MKILKYAVVLASPIIILSACTSGIGKMSPADPSKSADNPSLFVDTAKIKSDLNDVVNSITSGKPDTNKLKAAASDILSTDAKILSDSGIDKLTGNNPSAKAAGDMLKKFRDATGITPAALDSIKKAAASLGQ